MRSIITLLFTLLACSNFIHNPTSAFQLQRSQSPCSIKNSSSRKTVSAASRIISYPSSSSLDSTRNHDAPNDEKDTTESKTTTGATSATSPPTVVCIGETLWDSLPSGMYLGGAPANVAVHLASLFQHWASRNDEDDSRPPTVAVATCVGNDQLGREARRRLGLKGVRTDFIQFHEKWETGMSIAVINKDGDATYEFNTPAAWDGLSTDKALMDLVAKSGNSSSIINNNTDKNDDDNDRSNSNKDKEQSTKVFVMGTIAARLDDQHGATSSSSLAKLRNLAPEGSVVLDVNLRSPWYTKERLLTLARGTDTVDVDLEVKKFGLLKVNEEELVILEEWCGLVTPKENFENAEGEEQSLTRNALKERMEKLAVSLHTQRLCVTRGKDGAALWCQRSINCDDDKNESSFHENPGYCLATNVSNDSDTVGAGDAFLAALIHSHLICGESPDVALERACALGGYVAGCRGATPEHEDAPAELRRIFGGSSFS